MTFLWSRSKIGEGNEPPLYSWPQYSGIGWIWAFIAKLDASEWGNVCCGTQINHQQKSLHKIPWCFMILFRTQALLLLLSKCRNQWVYRSARYARISEINDRKLKCRKFYRQRTKKSMKTWPTPDWPWQIVALDIFYLERCSYLMIVHEYRNFFGRDFVKTQTVSGLISDQRAVFQWHGVSFHFYRTRFQQFSEHDILDTSPGDTAGDVARDTKMMVKRQNLG